LGLIASQALRCPNEVFLAAAQICAGEVTEEDLAVNRIYPTQEKIHDISFKIAVHVAEFIFKSTLSAMVRFLFDVILGSPRRLASQKAWRILSPRVATRQLIARTRQCSTAFPSFSGAPCRCCVLLACDDKSLFSFGQESQFAEKSSVAPEPRVKHFSSLTLSSALPPCGGDSLSSLLYNMSMISSYVWLPSCGSVFDPVRMVGLI
jgi:hypothetical protein